jgi:hypothetical protein
MDKAAVHHGPIEQYLDGLYGSPNTDARRC